MEINEVTRESIERCNQVMAEFNKQCAAIGGDCITFDQYLKLMDMDKIVGIEEMVHSIDDNLSEITYHVKNKAGDYANM